MTCDINIRAGGTDKKGARLETPNLSRVVKEGTSLGQNHLHGL